MTAHLPFIEGPLLEGRRLPGAGIGWLDQRRRSALAQFEQLGLPTQRLESWKYTKLRPLYGTRYRPVGEVTTGTVAEWVPDIGTGPRAVFVNGRLRADLSRLSGLPKGVRFGALEDAIRERPDWIEAHLGAIAGDGDQAMLALNSALMDCGFVLHVEAGVTVPEPIEVVYLSGLNDGPVAYFPRNLIVIGDNAQATLIKHHAGGGT
ncbi:MAG: Fe-S cluster assembly protein SufD, partial [Proteobacteria bacterium]|nr:Fe-S cluster assembly protein SufD [Pseudomonadota bacterium]